MTAGITVNSFNDRNHKNAIVQLENNFNTVCAALETSGHDSSNLTVMQYYAKIKFFKDYNKPKP